MTSAASSDSEKTASTEHAEPITPVAPITPIEPIVPVVPEPRAPGRWRGRRRWAVLATVVFLLVAAAGHWAYRIYDPGPDIALEDLAQLQVAHEGWVDVDVSGPIGESVARFFSAAAEAHALWPPDLLFE